MELWLRLFAAILVAIFEVKDHLSFISICNGDDNCVLKLQLTIMGSQIEGQEISPMNPSIVAFIIGPDGSKKLAELMFPA